MANIKEILDEPKTLSRILFWVGGILAGLSIFFYVAVQDRIDTFYQIQIPFGFLFELLAILSIIIIVFIITLLYDYLSAKEPISHFTPITKTILLMFLLFIAIGVQFFGMYIYQVVNVISSS